MVIVAQDEWVKNRVRSFDNTTACLKFDAGCQLCGFHPPSFATVVSSVHKNDEKQGRRGASTQKTQVLSIFCLLVVWCNLFTSLGMTLSFTYFTFPL